ADADADEDQQRQRAGFHDGERRLNELPFANAAKVDPGENANANQRNQPLRSHTQLNRVRRIGASKPRRADVGAWKPCITIRRDRRPQYAEKSPERDGDGGNRSRLDHNEKGPPIQKSHEWTHRLPRKTDRAPGGGNNAASSPYASAAGNGTTPVATPARSSQKGAPHVRGMPAATIKIPR